MHPQGALEEEAHVLGHGRALAEQVREHGSAGAGGMYPLCHLRELDRVAEQDERPRAGAERERVRERDLARLVDEEVVELGVELLPRRSQLVPATSSASAAKNASASDSLSYERPS